MRTMCLFDGFKHAILRPASPRPSLPRAIWRGLPSRLLTTAPYSTPGGSSSRVAHAHGEGGESMQGLSGGAFSASCLPRRHVARLRRILIGRSSARDCQFIPWQRAWALHRERLGVRGRGDSCVRAEWFFGGGERGSERDASSEFSDNANEDLLMFLFQLDLGTRIQYALNLKQYDAAQKLRNKLAEVEVEVVKQKAKRGAAAKSEAQDTAIKLLRLRADLHKVIDSENYAAAANLRDQISMLEAESLVISAKALAYDNAQYSFRLGQKVKHKLFGYRAVICGMDPFCCESSIWMEMAHVDKLSQGHNQPFYQVLVDVQADPNIMVAYVPEENLMEFSSRDDMGGFDHPFLPFLFYGMDMAGDYIPIKQLREKYNRPRYEVPTQDETE